MRREEVALLAGISDDYHLRLERGRDNNPSVQVLDVLASNPAAVAFSPRLVPGQNRLRSLLLDPGEREFHMDWDDAVVSFIATARQTLEGGSVTVNHPIVGALSLHREKLPVGTSLS